MRLAYIVGTYPQPSETFIAREMEGLRARGHEVRIFSLYPPESGPVPGVEYAWATPLARAGRRLMGMGPAAARWWDLIAAWGADVVVAHFGGRPSTVAFMAAGDVPLVLSLHARDIYVEAEHLLEKVARAAATVTCTQANVDFLRAAFPAYAEKIHLVYHGLPRVWLEAPVPERDCSRRPGRPALEHGAGRPGLRLLAVGRLVEKKGFGVLIAACARLESPYELLIIGDGPLRRELTAQAWRLRVVLTLPGWVSEVEVRAAYVWADVLCCPSVVARDGDRDGLPNVLVEGMSTGLPAVGSALSGILEAIVDGKTGLLTPPADVAALATALTRLTDAALRVRLGAAAARRVRERFDGEKWLGVLEEVLRKAEYKGKRAEG